MFSNMIITNHRLCARRLSKFITMCGLKRFYIFHFPRSQLTLALELCGV